jgi:hypothetical protein
MRALLLAPLIALLLAPLIVVGSPAMAQEKQRLSSTDVERRTALFFKAPDGMLNKVLPTGWKVNPPTAGPSKGFSLGVTLINQLVTQGPDGKALPARTYIVFIVPAKTDANAGGPMVFGGFMPTNGVPGAYGVYQAAKVTLDTQQSTAENQSRAEELWQATGEDGSAIEMQLTFDRGTPVRSKAEAKVYSAAKPDFYRVYQIDQAVDVVRSVPDGIDRATKFSIKVAGAKLAPMFEGVELVSISSIPWYSRSIYLPEF